MHRFGVLFCVLATIATAYAPGALAAREGRQVPAQEDSNSLASPDYEGYRPAWANPYAEPPEVGINDDPTPFDPADVDSGPSPLDPDAF